MANPKLLDKVRRPFTDSEVAWLWILSQVPTAGKNKGCFVASYRDLAKAWGWEKRRVISQINRWCQKGRLTKFVTDSPSDTIPDTRNVTPANTYQTPIRWHFRIPEIQPHTPPIILQEDTPDNSPKERKKPGPKPKKPTERDPNIKILFDFFYDQHLEIRGFRYIPVQGGYDAKTIERILSKIEDPEEVKARMVRYLRDDHRWMDSPEWTISGFAKKINAYAAESRSNGKSRAEKLREIGESLK